MDGANHDRREPMTRARGRATVSRRLLIAAAFALALTPVATAPSAQAVRTAAPAPRGGSTWSLVDVGVDHGCGIKTDGSAWCWGSNAAGQLGSAGGDSTAPRQVSGEGTWLSVDVGMSSSCGIKSDGSAWCWGWNSYGQLGNGTLDDASEPTPVSGGNTWRVLSVGTTTCGITYAGTARCWGWNGYGGLGDGGRRELRKTPGHVAGGRRWATISADSFGSCGVRVDNTAWCWGSGALGDGTAGASLAPVRVAGGGQWTSTSRGHGSGCGVRRNGTAWCWGDDDLGQLGNGRPLASATTRALLSGRAAWTGLSTGDAHACALRTDLSAWCWGQNGEGQVGSGGHRSIVPVPVEVAGGASWLQVAAGGSSSCGIHTDGTAWCWGRNDAGQLGDGTRTASIVPVQVAG